MSEHPIEGLMTTAMNSIQDMIDVNTIIGEPIETSNNIVIIPISKVSFGFAAGGSEFKGETIDEYKKVEKEEQIQYRLPFGGGAGAGVTINPIAFLVIQSNNVKLMPVNHSSSIDKLLDYVPDLIERSNNMMNRIVSNKKQETEKILKEMQKRSNNESSKKVPREMKETRNELNHKKEEAKRNLDKIQKQEEIDYEYEYDETQNNNEEMFPEDD